MAGKRRKHKNSSSIITFILIIVLIALMSYTAYILYDFVIKNNILSKDNRQNNDIVNKTEQNESDITSDKNKSENVTSNSTEKANINEIKKENNSLLQKILGLFQKNKNESDIENAEKNSDKSIESNIKLETNSNTSNYDDDNITNQDTNEKSEIVLKESEDISTSSTNSGNIQEEKNNIETISTNKKTEEKKTITKNFKVFLASLDSNDELFLTYKKIDITYTDSPIFSILSFLVSYNPPEPYLNLIPKGTKLKGAWIKQGILFLDFNEYFLANKNGIKAIEMQIYQVVNTVMQFNEVKGVRFLINGKAVKYYSEEGFILDITFRSKQFSPTVFLFNRIIFKLLIPIKKNIENPIYQLSICSSSFSLLNKFSYLFSSLLYSELKLDIDS